MLFLRPLHYSADISQPAKGLFGAGAHSDYGLLTILATDGTPGLQIWHQDQWIDVSHVPGALLINLGDMAERRAESHLWLGRAHHRNGLSLPDASVVLQHQHLLAD